MELVYTEALLINPLKSLWQKRDLFLCGLIVWQVVQRTIHQLVRL